MAASAAHRLISADAHVNEPLDLFQSRLPVAIRDRVPNPAATSPSKSVERFRSDDPIDRVAMQDVDGLDAEVLYPSQALWDAVAKHDDEVVLACVRAYNEWIAEFSAASPGRLIGLGLIPSTSVAEACTELVRSVEQFGLRGVVVRGWPGGVGELGTEEAKPFWEAVNDFGVPVSFHYAVSVTESTAPPTGIGPGVMPPMANVVMPLLRGAVLQQYPDVRLVFAHGDAGWVPHWLEFMDFNYVRRRHLATFALPFDDPDTLPSQFLRRRAWFTFRTDRSAVRNRHLIGSAHLMWASHALSESADSPDSREHAWRVTEGVPADERADLLAGNLARLYRLPGYEDGFSLQSLEAFDDLVHL